MIKENSKAEPSTEAGNIAKPLLGDVFKCKHCGHTLPNDYSLRTPESCYLCDENISLDELTSENPIEKHSLDKIHRPTSKQWESVIELSEIMINKDIPYSRIECVNFNSYMIHLKGGSRIGFDCISHNEYLRITMNIA